MMKRKDGYVLDTTYPIFFYKEMQPIWLSTTVSFLGFNSPKTHESFSYLELACATGLNLLVCAIHYPHSHFIGVDFNEQHIQQARAWADQLGLTNIEFICADFESYLQQTTQKFDFIVNHGTFSWISSEQQHHLLTIVNQCLADEGIFYLHYMCYPGSTALHPIQKLLNLVDQHTHTSSSESIELGKKLFHDLYQAGSFIQNAQIEAVLKTLENQNDYLAHEFLTDHWQPRYSVDVHEQVFQHAGISYIGSANPCENLDSLSIPQKLQPIIQNIKVPALREYLKDLARDAKQRIDIFQKNPTPLRGAEHLHVLSEIGFKGLPSASSKKIEYFDTTIGRIQAPQELLERVLWRLNQETLSFSDIISFPEFSKNTLFLIETIFLLMNGQYIHPILGSHHNVKKAQIVLLNQILKQQQTRLQVLEELPTVVIMA